MSAQGPENTPLIKEIANGKAWNGLPYVGPVMDYKENDKAESLPQFKYKTHVDLFDMSKAEDRTKYERVCNLISNGLGVLGFEETRYSETIDSWHVFIKWYEQYYTAPENKPGQA